MKYLGFGFVFLIFFIGCSGGGSKSDPSNCCSAPGINVVVVSPATNAAIDDNANLTLPITVKVTGDSTNAGVTWTLTPTSIGTPAGSLSAVQAFSVTYTPPASVSQTIEVNVIATSVTDPTRSATIPINVYPALAFTTAPSVLTTAFLNTNYTCYQVLRSSGSVEQDTCEVIAAGGEGPITWSVSDGVLPQGVQLGLSGSNPSSDQYYVQIVGIPMISGAFPFTLTATDATGNSVAQSLTINVAPGQLKVPTPTVMEFVPNAPPIANYAPYPPIQLEASGGVPPYTWSLAPGSSQPTGLHVSSTGVISLDPSYNPSGQGLAVVVMDSQSPVPAQAVFPAPGASSLILILNSETDNKTGSGNYVCPTSDSTNPDTAMPVGATYAFAFSGFGPNNVPVTSSGSFNIVDVAGDIAGVEYVNGSALPQTLTGSVAVDNAFTNHGCLTLATAVSSAQFRLVPTVQNSTSTEYTDGNLIEFDDATGTGTRGSGYFRLQTGAPATPVGSFAFRLSGWDASYSHFAMAGSATAAQNGSLTSVSVDLNDNGSYSGPLTGGGTIGAPQTINGYPCGCGTLSLTAGATTYNLVYYIVDANHLILNSANGQPLVAGEATASAGPFSQATLSNSHIYRFGGEVPGSPDVGVGVLHFDGSAAVSGTTYERSGGTANTTTVSAQYEVDPSSGRFSFSGTGVPVVGYAVPSSSGITGYLVGTGESAASGTMEFQTSSYPPGYQFGPIDGDYALGTEEMLDPHSTVIVGDETPGRSGQFGSAQDHTNYLYSSNLTGLTPFQEFDLFQYTWSADGSGTYGADTYMVTNASKFFYFDASPLNAYPTVVVGQCWASCQ